MDATLENVEREAFSLTAADRARLAMDLIKSLDNQDDADAEELWLQEAERRYREYREGNLPARPAEDVFRDAFAKLG
jgi:putative addiction module component (TIGR02574 family)